MRIADDCYTCFQRQAVGVCRDLGVTEYVENRVVRAVTGVLDSRPESDTPPELAVAVYEAVTKVLGVRDPLAERKKKDNESALRLVPDVRFIIGESSDRLAAAVKGAVLGNVIDYAADPDFDIASEINEIFEKEFAVYDYDLFKKELNEARWVLYIGDNAGEAAFDRLLIEETGKQTVYMTRGAPIINDCLVEDAFACGLGEVADVVSSGCPMPGLVLDRCSDEAVELFRTAPLIIAKGMGNFEALSEVEAPIYFLLKIKCGVVARYTGYEVGDFIFIRCKQSKGVKETL
jgi:uncharacterized protein with ATP-grasp and redox domains